MITVTVYRNNNKSTGFLIEGHAEYDDPGKDIVCSAVSVLAINTINSISELTDDKPDVKSSKNGGKLKLVLKNPSDKADLLLKSFEIGINSIEDEYGDFVDVVYLTN